MVLKMVVSTGIKHLHIFGDLLLVIEWLQPNSPPKNIFLKPLYEDIYRLLSSFEEVNFHHIYKEHNIQAYQLSKKGLQFVEGTGEVWEVKKDIIKDWILYHFFTNYLALGKLYGLMRMLDKTKSHTFLFLCQKYIRRLSSLVLCINIFYESLSP